MDNGTGELVTKLRAEGSSWFDIAAVVGLNPKDLREKYDIFTRGESVNLYLGDAPLPLGLCAKHKSIIYFIFAREVGRMKIGVTTNIYSRLGQLQSSSPIELELFLCLYGGSKSEKRIHNDLQEHNVKGEWFAMNDYTMTYLYMTYAKHMDAIAYSKVDIKDIVSIDAYDLPDELIAVESNIARIV